MALRGVRALHGRRCYKATKSTLRVIENELRCLLLGTPFARPPTSGSDERALPNARSNDHKPVLGSSCLYSVVGVAMEEGKVLMIQEAKPQYRGTWSLPAGSMEQGQTIVDAVKREFKEETGMDYHPQSLLAIHCHGLSKLRFIFVGKVVGGKLKTTSEADKESLQAGWFTSDVSRLPLEIPLRLKDVLTVIDVANQWKEPSSGIVVMPTLQGYTHSCLKVVAVHCQGDKLHVLQSSHDHCSLPSSVSDNDLIIEDIIPAVLKDNGLSRVDQMEVIGVLSVEHDPVGVDCSRDGVCLTLLVRSAAQLGGGAWVTLEDGLVIERLRTALTKGTNCIPLIEDKAFRVK